MFRKKISLLLSLVVILSFVLAACSSTSATLAPANTEAKPSEPTKTDPTQAPVSEPTNPPAEEPAAEPTAAGPDLSALSGDIVADGSSTVFPITTAVAEEFALVAPQVRVSVGLSGTGGGFKVFCVGETDISDASRPIKDAEAETCKSNSIEYVQFLIAMDGLTVMVNPENDWLKELTVEQLAALLGDSSTITKWSDLDPSYPDENILFFIPDPDSGTRDYMTEIIAKVSEVEDLRQDENTTFSSDDNVLLDGIANEKYSFGFFGFAYYITNKDAVRAVPIVNKDGKAVLPSDETVQDGSYNPLSRPLFIYVNVNSLKTKPQVAEFVRFFMGESGAAMIMSDVGYSMPPSGTYEANLELLNSFQ
jgi:phosphate transport system substrate-binding protein